MEVSSQSSIWGLCMEKVWFFEL